MKLKSNPKQHALIGIDVGSRAVKIVRVAAGDGGAASPVFATAPVPLGAVEDGLVIKPDEVTSAISAALASAAFAERDAVASLSGSAVVVRPATLPRMKGSELLQAARWEAQRHIPLPLEELVIDCAVCGEDSAQPGMVQVMIAGGQRRAASAMAASLVKAGVRPVALDADSLAAYRALVHVHPSATVSGSVALLDIGGAGSRLWMFAGQQLQVSRAISVGTDHIVADLAPACEALAGELRRSLEFFSLRGKQVITDIYLLGGGAGIPGVAPALAELLSEALAERLAGGTRMKVELLDPGSGPHYALAFGLTLWEGR